MDIVKYQQLLYTAKRLVASTYQFTEYDIVHDAIIEYGEDVNRQAIKTIYHKLNRVFKSELLIDPILMDRESIRSFSDVVCSDKLCKRCKNILPISFFPERKMRGVLVRNWLCSKCDSEYSSEFRKKHPKKTKIAQAKAYKKWVNKPGVKEKIKKRLSASGEVNRRLATDSYIRQILCREGIKSKDATSEMIENRRIKLLEFREKRYNNKKHYNENRIILNNIVFS